VTGFRRDSDPVECPPAPDNATDPSELGWRYRLLVENTADVVIHTIEGVLQWVSPSIEDLTGWSPAELVGSTTAHLWHPDDLRIAVAQRDATYAGKPTRNTLRLRSKNGQYLWLDVALKPYLEPDGRIGAVGSLRDVSALVDARTAAERQERQLQRVFDSMLEPHLLLSPVTDAGHVVSTCVRRTPWQPRSSVWTARI
jgi:PAS domain S-box-containing protein